MSTLTDRYISEVVRRLPEDQRGDISSEIAATIEDMVAAELADTPTADPDSSERAVLTRLGDPAELARRYSGARRYLIGPDVYPVWLRVLRRLMPIVGLIAAVASGALYVATTPGAALGGLIGEVVSGVAAALMWVFTAWTLVVVVVERSTPEGGRPALGAAPTWNPDALDRPAAPTESRVEAGVSLALLGLLAAIPFLPSTFLYVGHLNGGEPLIDPGIPVVWRAGYLALLAILGGLQVWRLLRPGRSRARGVVDATTDVAFGVFLTALVLSRDSVLHPDIVAAGPGDPASTAIRWILIAAIWLVVAWNQIETARTYRRDPV